MKLKCEEKLNLAKVLQLKKNITENLATVKIVYDFYNTEQIFFFKERSSSMIFFALHSHTQQATLIRLGA